MPQGKSGSNHHSIRIALFGLLVLTLGMGIGRFLYTPMLPVLLTEGQFTFSQLSWIASANYAGYLAGSLLFSFALFHQPSRLRPMLLASALATTGLITAMAFYSARTDDGDPLSGRCRQCRYDDLWFDGGSAAYPSSVCDCGPVLRCRDRHFSR